MVETTPCPGCGLVLPEHDGPIHAYIGASPACWSLFGEVLAREFSDPDYFRIHQITVDTYAVQHPGKPERRSIQSVALHLMTLYLFLERGVTATEGPTLHTRMNANKPPFHWLEPPQPNGRLTIAHVHEATTADEHEERVMAWARDIWAAWKPHHAVVREWLDHTNT